MALTLLDLLTSVLLTELLPLPAAEAHLGCWPDLPRTVLLYSWKIQILVWGSSWSRPVLREHIRCQRVGSRTTVEGNSALTFMYVILWKSKVVWMPYSHNDKYCIRGNWKNYSCYYYIFPNVLISNRSHFSYYHSIP